jgi:two-component system sensor histidine kinase KdpD
LGALADQAAVAVERIKLAGDVDAARLQAESDRLRAALLTSVSHDLKTPLSTIIGAITSIRSYGDRYDAQARDALLADAQEEAERLGRFVANLLDMTRLDAGPLTPKQAPVDLGELVGTVARRAQALLARHRLTIDVAPELLPVPLDFVLTEQVLFNLLDNAAKYAPPGTAIAVRIRRVGVTVEIDVEDEGPGIPDSDLERIFEKFYRVREGDRRRAGTGLGLAIARGFIAAQGGTLVAANRRDRSGARFTIRLPL